MDHTMPSFSSKKTWKENLPGSDTPGTHKPGPRVIVRAMIGICNPLTEIDINGNYNPDSHVAMTHP